MEIRRMRCLGDFIVSTKYYSLTVPAASASVQRSAAIRTNIIWNRAETIEDRGGVMRLISWPQIAVSALLLIALGDFATLAHAQEYGIKAKRPVIAGACKTCPWGALAEIVKAAMAPYGYDVQICYNCATSEGPREVAGGLKAGEN